MLFDTHCHIHENQFYNDDERAAVYARAQQSGVKMICIGTSQAHSKAAVEFSEVHENVWSTIGVHPHDVKDGWREIESILHNKSKKLVGIGEVGLDYFYEHSPRELQIEALEEQLQWAQEYNLPVSFHVREAFDDFWPVLANFKAIRGVLHSFTDSFQNLEQALSRDLFIGVNGISTFSRTNQDTWDAVPLNKMLLETDAPFLTPKPLRGKVNEPAFVRHVAEYHAERRRVELEQLARVTSANASRLFSI